MQQDGGLRKIYLAPSTDFDIVKTFECGQCFRWHSTGENKYMGVVRSEAAEVRDEGGRVYLTVSAGSDENVWRNYFDLENDYSKISGKFLISPYMSECVEFGWGIRILRQDKWEALCSFIISQCNNIPRIKKIVESLCEGLGRKIDFRGEIYYAFPRPEDLAGLEPEDLAFIKAGYRAQYIIDAAKAVASGEIDLDAMSEMSHKEAQAILCGMNGIGKKVSNCVILYGLSIMSGFPVDVWMKRALAEHFPPDFDPAVFGEYAGVAQQYMFYHAKSVGK